MLRISFHRLFLCARTLFCADFFLHRKKNFESRLPLITEREEEREGGEGVLFEMKIVYNTSECVSCVFVVLKVQPAYGSEACESLTAHKEAQCR